MSAADWIFKENYALVLAALFQHEFARGLRAYFRAGSMPLTRWCSYHQVDYEHWLNIRRGVVRLSMEDLTFFLMAAGEHPDALVHFPSWIEMAQNTLNAWADGEWG